MAVAVATTAELIQRKLVIILGVPVDVITMNEALDRVSAFVKSGRRTGRSYQVATVNADFLVNAIKDPEIRHILQEADLATADGMPVVFGANVLGVELGDRVTGADMVPLLAERAAREGLSIYFLGSEPGVAARAAEVLKQKNPGLRVAGVYSPPFQPILKMDPSIVTRVRDANPDILLVAFGNPKQEKWIAMHRYDLNVPVMMGVGATLDFIAGSSVRAPRWMQKSGLEWLHRFARDPRRLWRRYVLDFIVFGFFLTRQLWEMRRFGNLPVTLPVSDEMVVNGIGVLRVQGVLSVANLAAFTGHAQRLISQANQLVVDFSQVDYIDSAAVGTLVHLTKELRAQGGELYIISISQKIQKTLEMLRLEKYLNIQGRLEDILYQGKNVRRTAQSSNHAHAITVIGDQTWKVVRAPFRIDASNAGQFHEECLSVLAEPANLLIDFSNTSMLASAGLAVLADLHRKAQPPQGCLIIKGVGKDVLQILRLSKFDQFLTIE